MRLKERIRSARANEIRAVVVFALDRSSRSPRDFYNFLALLQEKRIELISASQDLDTTTPFGRAFLGLAMIWASLEADIDSQRASEAIAWKQQHGIHVGDTPIGYHRERRTINVGGDTTTTSVLLVAPDEAETVKQIYQLYSTGKYSFRSLAHHLNTLGKRTKNKNGRRNLFTHKNIQIILGNHWLYRGWVIRRDRGTGRGESEGRARGYHL